MPDPQLLGSDIYSGYSSGWRSALVELVCDVRSEQEPRPQPTIKGPFQRQSQRKHTQVCHSTRVAVKLNLLERQKGFNAFACQVEIQVSVSRHEFAVKKILMNCERAGTSQRFAEAPGTWLEHDCEAVAALSTVIWFEHEIPPWTRGSSDGRTPGRICMELVME